MAEQDRYCITSVDKSAVLGNLTNMKTACPLTVKDFLSQ